MAMGKGILSFIFLNINDAVFSNNCLCNFTVYFQFKEIFGDVSGYGGVELKSIRYSFLTILVVSFLNYNDYAALTALCVSLLRCGSITVDLALKFSFIVKENDVITILRNSMKNGAFKELNLMGLPHS